MPASRWSTNCDDLSIPPKSSARYPEPTDKGVGILTFSGAFCAIAHDFCESIGFEVPPCRRSGGNLKKRLPAFISPHNPLDLTTQPIWEPDLVGLGAKTLLDDPAIGALVISITVGGPEQSVKYIKGIIEALKGNKKPMVFSVLGDTSPLAPEFPQLARDNQVILSRSSERSLRAMAQVTAHGHAVAAAKNSATAMPPNLPKLGSGPQPEWLGKQVLAAAGIRIPEGALPKSADEAVATAKKIGFPVAMKAQAAMLAHKTEAGGVLLEHRRRGGRARGVAEAA